MLSRVEGGNESVNIWDLSFTALKEQKMFKTQDENLIQHLRKTICLTHVDVWVCKDMVQRLVYLTIFFAMFPRTAATASPSVGIWGSCTI